MFDRTDGSALVDQLRDGVAQSEECLHYVALALQYGARSIVLASIEGRPSIVLVVAWGS